MSECSLDYLYFITGDKIEKAKIVKENAVNFIVESKIKNQFEIVNKKAMKTMSKQYYQHPFLAKENFFVEKNAYLIGKKLQESKNAFLLRQVAHNLEIEEELIDITYEGENNV